MNAHIINRRRALAGLAAGAALVAGFGALAKPAAPAASQLKFVASQADVPVPGEFRKFSADIDFDPAQPAAGKVNIEVDVGSVATGSGDADAMLVSKDFFDAAHYPRAGFASTAIAPEAGGKFRATGQFTLKGHSLPLTVPFSTRTDAKGIWFEGNVPISRLAYKVGEGEWTDTGTLADKVQIEFKLYVAR